MEYNSNVLFCLLLLTLIVLICSCDNNVYIDEEIKEEDDRSKTDTDTHIHSFQYMHNENEHWLECSACGEEKNWENHNLKWYYDEIGHWQGCDDCGYNLIAKLGKEDHVYGDDDICDICSYDRIKPSGISIFLEDKDPRYQITNFHVESNSFCFTLSPGSDSKSVPNTITWKVFFIDNNFVEHSLKEDSSNKYTFSFESSLITNELKGRLVCVMCTYSNEYGTFSTSFEKYGYEYFNLGGLS